MAHFVYIVVWRCTVFPAAHVWSIWSTHYSLLFITNTAKLPIHIIIQTTLFSVFRLKSTDRASRFFSLQSDKDEQMRERHHFLPGHFYFSYRISSYRYWIYPSVVFQLKKKKKKINEPLIFLQCDTCFSKYEIKLPFLSICIGIKIRQ